METHFLVYVGSNTKTKEFILYQCQHKDQQYPFRVIAKTHEDTVCVGPVADGAD